MSKITSPKKSLLSIFLFSCLLVSCTRPLGEEKLLISAREVVIETEEKPISFLVEIADTEQKRAQGLMYRTHLLANQGMLFIFNQTKNHPFWMKNTQIPLDIIFFDEKWRIVGILENMKPFDTTLRRIENSSRYALELPAGSAKKFALNENATGRLQ